MDIENKENNANECIKNKNEKDELPNFPFKLNGLIGKGGFATIYSAIDPKSKQIFAIKLINFKRAKKYNFSKKSMQIETTIHKYVSNKKHPNIIKFFNFGFDKNWYWICMEKAVGGDLFDKIDPDNGVSIEIVHFYFFQLIQAISFLQSIGVAHRDIKPENIFLDNYGNLKIGDFGLSTIFKHNGLFKKVNDIVGSPPYLAPEVIKPPYDASLSDIWSCGIVLIVLLTGCTPWDEPTTDDINFRTFISLKGRSKNLYPWSKIPPDCLSLIRAMLKINPNDRFTINEILQHPWLTQQNYLLGDNGLCLDPVLLATKLFDSLYIDINKLPSVGGSNTDLNSNFDSNFESQIPSFSQPIQPLDNFITVKSFESGFSQNFDYNKNSMSQPIGVRDNTSSGNLTNLLDFNDAERIVRETPSHLQFTHDIPESFTQRARYFMDICPSNNLTQFHVKCGFDVLIPRLKYALHRLAVPLPVGDYTAYYSVYITIKIHATDRRRCPLSGEIECKKLSEKGGALTQVTLTRSTGDPIEWRFFFKKLLGLCKDLLYITN